MTEEDAVLLAGGTARVDASAPSAALPPLYDGWLRPWLGSVASEQRATCASCAMCLPEGSARVHEAQYYSPDTKCCTYLPELANFLVGRVLGDDSPDAAEGRATVEQRLAQRVAVTPLGFTRSKVYTLLYERSQEAFGSANSLKCPHYLADGRCGVWRHRESTCATWFCKHERGQVGKHFWRRVHDLLAAAENQLARHCVLELGLAASALERLYPPRGAAARHGFSADQLDGEVDETWYRAIWGQYAEREGEFFQRCAAIVAKLSWSDVLAIGGTELRILADLVREAQATLKESALPQRARTGSLRVVFASAGAAHVSTYSSADPLRVPRRVLDVLHHFDGRPTTEAMAAVHAETGLRMSPGLVLKLADFGLLSDDEK